MLISLLHTDFGPNIRGWRHQAASPLTATPGVNIHDLHCRWVTWTGCRRGWWRRSLWTGAPPPPVGPGSGWVRWGVHSSPSLRTPSRRRTAVQSSAVPPKRQREESRTRATGRCASCCLRQPARPSSGGETVDGGNDRRQPVAWRWRHVRWGNVVLGYVLVVLAVNKGPPPPLKLINQYFLLFLSWSMFLKR